MRSDIEGVNTLPAFVVGGVRGEDGSMECTYAASSALNDLDGLADLSWVVPGLQAAVRAWRPHIEYLLVTDPPLALGGKRSASTSAMMHWTCGRFLPR